MAAAQVLTNACPVVMIRSGVDCVRPRIGRRRALKRPGLGLIGLLMSGVQPVFEGVGDEPAGGRRVPFLGHQHADDLPVLGPSLDTENAAPGGKSGPVSHVPACRSFSYSARGMLPRHGSAAHDAPAQRSPGDDPKSCPSEYIRVGSAGSRCAVVRVC